MMRIVDMVNYDSLRDGGSSMCGAASVQSFVIRIPYISKWSLGTENHASRTNSSNGIVVFTTFGCSSGFFLLLLTD